MKGLQDQESLFWHILVLQAPPRGVQYYSSGQQLHIVLFDWSNSKILPLITIVVTRKKPNYVHCSLSGILQTAHLYSSVPVSTLSLANCER